MFVAFYPVNNDKGLGKHSFGDTCKLPRHNVT